MPEGSDDLDWDEIVADVEASRSELDGLERCECGGELKFTTQQVTDTHDLYEFNCVLCRKLRVVKSALRRPL